MKNILAENMLRFGVKNLSDKSKRKLTRQSRLDEQANQAKPATIKYKQLYNLKPGDSNPASYINELVKGVMTSINNDPEAKKMLASKSIKLTRAKFTAGASNSWGGKPTGFDRELTSNAILKPTETVLYQLNKDLAKLRATECKKALSPLLQKQGIVVSPLLDTQSLVDSAVYNTGGKLDLNGQFISVILVFEYLTPADVFAPTDIKQGFIAHGAFYTKTGKSGTNNPLDPASLQLSTGQLTPELIASNRLAAFEIKWNPNIINDPFKKPWYRWVFIYNKLGKIERIKGEIYDTSLNSKLQNFFKPNDNIPPTDPTMIAMMNLVRPDYYKTVVQQYL